MKIRATRRTCGDFIHRFFAMLLMVILSACTDDESLVTFSGEITTTNDRGETEGLEGIPVEIRLYKNFPIHVSDKPETVVLLTDEAGRYTLQLPSGKYEACVDARVVDDYYRSCSGALRPVEMLIWPRQINNVRNAKDISVCLTSRFKIALHKTSGSMNTVEYALGGKTASFTVLMPGTGTNLTDDTYLNILPSVSVITFRFNRKNSNGEIVDTSSFSYEPVPGSTQVIDVNY